MLQEMLYGDIILIVKKEIIVGNITGDVFYPIVGLEITQNECQHKIFLYVQYSYRWKKFKGQKLSGENPSQLVLGYPQNIRWLVPIPSLPIKHYVLI